MRFAVDKEREAARKTFQRVAISIAGPIAIFHACVEERAFSSLLMKRRQPPDAVEGPPYFGGPYPGAGELRPAFVRKIACNHEPLRGCFASNIAPL